MTKKTPGPKFNPGDNFPRPSKKIRSKPDPTKSKDPLVQFKVRAARKLTELTGMPHRYDLITLHGEKDEEGYYHGTAKIGRVSRNFRMRE